MSVIEPYLPPNSDALAQAASALHVLETLHAQKKLAQAVTFCTDQLQPSGASVELCFRVAEIFLATDAFLEALQWLIHLPPGQGEGHVCAALEGLLQKIMLQQGGFASALPFLQHYAPVFAAVAPMAFSTFKHLWKQGLYTQADAFAGCCEGALAQLPIPAHQFYRDWGVCAYRSNAPETARARFEKAAQLAPNPLFYAFDELNYFPRIYQSEAEMLSVRQKFQFNLEKLIKRFEAQRAKGRISKININYPFGLAYQGLNDKALVSRLGQFWHRAIYGTDALQSLDYVPQRGGPLKLAMVSSYFYKHSVMVAYGPLFKQIGEDPEIELSIVYLGEVIDQTTLDLHGQAQHFVHLPDPLQAMAYLRTLQPDVLIYPDIGMNPKSYVMALHRLAPIQVVMGGHPVTTGIPHMDYVFGVDGKELPEAQTHYSETLLRLPHIMTRREPVALPELLPREQWGWFPQDHIYFCPMMLFKVHPSFDQALCAILAQDPQAKIWFVKSKTEPEIEPLLRQRFSKTIPADLVERIDFMPWMSMDQFKQAILAADVVLDSFAFGGGTTTRMTMGLFQPMVTLPGDYFRSRNTQYYYRYMKMGDEALATDIADYANKAVAIATDLDLRKRLQAELKAKLYTTYEGGCQASYEMFKAYLLEAAQIYPKTVASRTF